MSRRRHIVVGNIVAGAAIAGLTGSLALLSTPLLAQTTSFRDYRCADGTRFLVANYPYDSRMYLQIDGGPLTLKRRFSVWGTRYSEGGITLKIDRTGQTTLKHPGRPETVCKPT